MAGPLSPPTILESFGRLVSTSIASLTDRLTLQGNPGDQRTVTLHGRYLMHDDSGGDGWRAPTARTGKAVDGSAAPLRATQAARCCAAAPG